jgi:hypothetical protein
MSRTVAPLLSFSASGQIAKTQVYSSWKGRPYVRRYTIPANPNSSDQQLTRNTFRWLTNLWKFMPGSATDAWKLFADSSRITDRNAWIKLNNGPLREETDLLNMTISPSARSGLIAAGITATPGAGQLTVALTAPDLPQGWTISNSYAAAIADQDPQTETLYAVTAGTDATAPYSIVLTGLDTVLYLVGGWFQFTRPDGTFAYGRSLQVTATPS